jgi:hypothetical protein
LSVRGYGSDGRAMAVTGCTLPMVESMTTSQSRWLLWREAGQLHQVGGGRGLGEAEEAGVDDTWPVGQEHYDQGHRLLLRLAHLQTLEPADEINQGLAVASPLAVPRAHRHVQRAPVTDTLEVHAAVAVRAMRAVASGDGAAGGHRLASLDPPDDDDSGQAPRSPVRGEAGTPSASREPPADERLTPLAQSLQTKYVVIVPQPVAHGVAGRSARRRPSGSSAEAGEALAHDGGQLGVVVDGHRRAGPVVGVGQARGLGGLLWRLRRRGGYRRLGGVLGRKAGGEA